MGYKIKVNNEIFNVKIEDVDNKKIISEIKELIDLFEGKDNILCLKVIEEYFKYKNNYLEYEEKKNSFFYKNGIVVYMCMFSIFIIGATVVLK